MYEAIEAKIPASYCNIQCIHFRTQRLFETAGLKDGSKILDVGSYAGVVPFMAAVMVGLRGSVVGFDNASLELEKARLYAGKAGLSLRYV